MNDLARDLFYYMEDNYSSEVESPACRKALHDLDRALEEAEECAGRALRDKLYSTALRCVSEEQHSAFRLGLRLGLQLHTL